MGYHEKIFLTVICFLLTAAGFAQDLVTVKGLVADSASHRPIPYVNIIIKHTTKGTTTDKNGYFTLLAQPADTILFSFIGYQTLEFPVMDWEPSVILLAEHATILSTIIIKGAALPDPYEHLFDEENIKLKNSRQAIPFYYPKEKKEKILLGRAKAEQKRVKHYVDLLVKDDRVKNELMKKHKLTENEYYDILTKFNEKNYAIMYYLTDSELLSLLYRFYEANAPK